MSNFQAGGFNTSGNGLIVFCSLFKNFINSRVFGTVYDRVYAQQSIPEVVKHPNVTVFDASETNELLPTAAEKQ